MMLKLEMVLVILAASMALSRCFLFPSFAKRSLSFSRPRIMERNSLVHTPRVKVGAEFKLSMLEETVTEEEAIVIAPVDDFLSYRVGQEYTGTLTTIKKNGAQVNFTATESAIIPKSRVSLIDFEKLKGMHKQRSQEPVTVEIIDINVQNRTMYAKYADKTNTQRASLKTLAAMDATELRKLRHNATVVSGDDNGVYVQFDEYAIAGFVATDKLPNSPPAAHVSKLYTQGKAVVVNIEYLDLQNQQLVLAMPREQHRLEPGEVTSYIDVSTDLWVQSEIVKVEPHQLHVRQAYHDTPGTVSVDQIPPELIEILKKRVAADLPLGGSTNINLNSGECEPNSSGTDIKGKKSKQKQYKYPSASKAPYTYPPTVLNMPTDLTRLFTKGDIVKSRLLSVNFDTKQLDLTMLPSEADLERYKEPEVDFGVGYDDEEHRSAGPRVDRSDDKSDRGGRGGGGGRGRGGEQEVEFSTKRDSRGFSEGLLEKYNVNTKDVEIMGVTMSKEELMDAPNNTINYYTSSTGEVVQWTEAEEEADYVKAIEAENNVLRHKLLNQRYQEVYEPEKVLEWWRGEPYQTTAELNEIKKVAARALSDGILETDEEIMEESHEMTQGNWRRLFTIDTMQDKKDFQATELEVELQQIEDEIGELEGLHLAFERPMPDYFPTIKDKRNFPLGTMIDRNIFPPDILKDLTFYKDLDARMESIRQQDKGWRYSKAGDLDAIKEVYDRIEADAALGEAEEAAERSAGGHSGSGRAGSKFSSARYSGGTGSSSGVSASSSTGGGVYSGSKGGKWSPKGASTGSAGGSVTSSDTTGSRETASKTSSPGDMREPNAGSASSTVKPEVPRRVWTKKGDLGGGYRGYGSVILSTDSADASNEQHSTGL